MSDPLLAAVRKRFAAPEYAFFPEVPNCTGGASRTCDGLAMSLWRSRGLELIGMEFKRSRGDWLRELKNPAKAESILRYCDRWLLVVSDAALVQPGELPPTWGLLALEKGRLVQKVAAPKLKAEPVNRPFLASLFRTVHERSAEEKELKAIRTEGYLEGYAAGKASLERTFEHRENAVQSRYDWLKRAVDEFEEASGLKIGAGQNPKALGEAVRVVQEARVEGYFARFDKLRQEFALLHGRMQEIRLPAEGEA